MQEVWKPVKEFEELYQISNLGNIMTVGRYRYNLNTKKIIYEKINKLLKPTNDRGYLKIALSKKGKKTIKYIHRLVAEAFISNPNNYKEVNHKDNNPTNNKVENLEWCDREYNLKYMIEHQERIRELNEMRHEALEDVYYGILNQNIKTLDDVIEMIQPILKENE